MRKIKGAWMVLIVLLFSYRMYGFSLKESHEIWSGDRESNYSWFDDSAAESDISVSLFKSNTEGEDREINIGNTEKDEEISVTAAPPGGGHAQKIPLNGRGWMSCLFLALSSLVYYIYIERKDKFSQ